MELLRKNARRHYWRKGVTPMHFFTLTQVIKLFLQEKLGALMSQLAISGWEKLFGLLVQTTKLEYKRMAEESGAAIGKEVHANVIFGTTT